MNAVRESWTASDHRAAPLSHIAVLRDPLPGVDPDLRLYSPRPEVVVVRVSGAVDQRGAELLGERVGQQLARATHVVLDLAGVPGLGRWGARVLAELDREATRCGAFLHIAGVEEPEMREQLRTAHLDTAPCADAVVALIPARLPRRRWRH
ncbi:STAS domain-containing protein [Pseudonocardia sp.]|uniref:STAS domain-containing protein n=1 Tax=Pseudonocardia sp. TaxID=60912 RepID=UPI00262CE6E0|nr:STAS domain-containing protein [Pseudonocardia sp.]